jgi:ABC-type transport system involved in multi-copper enzyme maturation permease subunit
MSKFTKTLIGFVIVVFFLSILTGNITQVVSLLLMSIVCNAGVGLIFWIGLSFIIGSITLEVIEKVFKKYPKDSVHEQPLHLSNNELALNAYIAQCLQLGVRRENIQNALIQKGWRSDDIQKALAHP